MLDRAPLKQPHGRARTAQMQAQRRVAASRPSGHATMVAQRLGRGALLGCRWQQHLLRWQRPAPNATRVPAVSQQGDNFAAAPSLHLPEVLERVRAAVSINSQIRRNNEVVMLGTGKHLGTDISWSLRWLPSGAYLEEIRGKHMSFKWGWDGGEGSSCWEQDNTGVARYLEYDDHESMLLSSLVRTGCWLLPEISTRLEMHLQTHDEPGDADADMQHPAAEQAEGSSGGGGGTSSSSAGGPTSSASSSSTTTTTSTSTSASSLVALPQQSQPKQQQNFWVALRLRSGRIQARVRVCSSSFRPLGVSYPLSGDVEVWKFKGWRLWTTDLPFPEQMVHYANTGAFHRYNATTHLVHHASALPPGYGIPFTPLLPEDASYASEGQTALPAWHCASGHIVVNVELSGQPAGYMLLDTGANGFVIEQETADRLQLQDFGELYAFGIAGKLKTRFRKAASLRLGPLQIKEPVFMEMPMAGLIRDAPGPVVGIIGYDLFRRAVVGFPQHPSYAPAAATVSPALPAATPGSSSTAQPPPTAAGAAGSSTGSSSSSSRGGYTAAAATNSSTARGKASAAPRSSHASRPSYPQRCSLLLQDPNQLSPADESRYRWVPLIMIANLPHVEVTFQNTDGKVHSALFMIDSGAGGADIMFHSRATKELGLVPSKQSHKTRYVKGVGGEQSLSMRVEQGDVPWVEIAGNRLECVKCLFCSSHSLLDVSLYSMGIICADLLTRTATVVDYSRKRIGFPNN